MPIRAYIPGLKQTDQSDYTSKLGKDIDKPGGPKTHLTYGFATQVAILDDEGALRKHVSIVVNGATIRDRAGLSDAVGPDAEIFVMQALSGG